MKIITRAMWVSFCKSSKRSLNMFQMSIHSDMKTVAPKGGDRKMMTTTGAIWISSCRCSWSLNSFL